MGYFFNEKINYQHVFCYTFINCENSLQVGDDTHHDNINDAVTI